MKKLKTILKMLEELTNEECKIIREKLDKILKDGGGKLPPPPGGGG